MANYRVTFNLMLSRELAVVQTKIIKISNINYTTNMQIHTNLWPRAGHLPVIYIGRLVNCMNLEMFWHTSFFMDSHWYGSIDVLQTGCPHDNLRHFLCICKLVPPLPENLFSSITWKLNNIMTQKWCLHLCFHGQGMQWNHRNDCNFYS